LTAPIGSAHEPDYAIRPVPPASVAVRDAFWAPRLETNRTVTIAHNLQQLESQGSLGGFRILSGKSGEKYHGYMWGDSDVYKTLEGMTYGLQACPDPKLNKQMEEIFATVVGAQAADGYLMPHVQIAAPAYTHFKEESTQTCELYSMGHMIESALAHYQATGRRNSLQAAIKLADLIVKTYGPGGIEKPSGHPEIELALIRLYRVTNDRRYLELAAALVDRAQRIPTTWTQGKPALSDDEATGHAVAMQYLYSAATDVAVLTGNRALMGLLERKWANLVGRKLYLTGNAGHESHGEGFGPNYDLPNGKGAYNETCAAIANIFWNQRMFLASGDAKYLDVLERALYNGVLPGVSLRGNRFFYANPLEADGKRPFSPDGSCTRFPWCGCPCCPTNIVRFLPQIPGYAYATGDESLYVNLFMAGAAKLKVGDRVVELRQETRYPWDGRIMLAVNPQGPSTFTLHLRIPGWARNRPLPSDLYRYADSEKPATKLAVNGQPADLVVEKGFASLRRPWKAGDVVTLELSMPVRRVVAHDAVSADRRRFAVERGPIVYCAEGADNGGRVLAKVPGRPLKFVSRWQPDLLGGVVTIRILPAAAGNSLTLIPYYAWCHRGPNEMAVWLRAE
jgi:DUF1680 family protein